MADFKKALAKVLAWEGGFVNHPNDPGGATNKGITLKTFNYYFPGGLAALKAITDEQVETIYRSGYWRLIKGDEIESQSVAELLFDYAVNSGKSTAVRKIQKLVGVEADGIMGPITIKAINSKNPKLLFAELHDVRKAYYKAIIARNPSLEVFRKGWNRRLDSYVFER